MNKKKIALYSILLGIALLSKGQWCYLALMLIIGFNEEPIATTLLKLFDKYCDKMKPSPMSERDEQIKKQKEIDEIIKIEKVKSEELMINEDVKKRWKPYISDNGDLYYDDLQKATLKLINSETELDFKSSIKFIGNNNTPDLYPDAISEKFKNKLVMLEIKTSCYGTPKTTLKRGITSIEKYTNYVNNISTDKVVDFWLVLILNEMPSEEEMKVLNKQFLEYAKTHSDYEYRLLIYPISALKK